ncbi:LLM class flavin-dependent oxidoreductase [Desertivirga brevis]|uniref:LLM class flavin-dependent oxidoreductase n=1 Tax=Desertivirga brevis TaxID=2810310 RepID=UPI001F60BA3A|nr:LLM class flavin-dependent oxidoreductase [Pedobacter sp. SYSU D00873]
MTINHPLSNFTKLLHPLKGLFKDMAVICENDMNERNSKYIPLSILDLVPVLQDHPVEQSFKNSLDLAQHAELMGYNRYWLAEHHNMAGIASSATSVVMAYVAGGTEKIRVGSGGIMLPNHAPLVIAEQFGTLARLYPGRIDMGLGRAPGTDQTTAMALRRNLTGSVEDFPSNVMELRNYFSAENSQSKVRAIQAEGLEVPVWLLGSSTYSAQLSAYWGLPFAFASHFAPQMLYDSLRLYRDNFRPSEVLSKPYAMAGINVIAAPTDEEAHFLATSLYRAFLNVIRGTALPMQVPVEDMEEYWTVSEKYAVQQMLNYTFIGGPETLTEKIQAFIDKTGVDELMVGAHIYDHHKRVRSYEILAGLPLKTAS